MKALIIEDVDQKFQKIVEVAKLADPNIDILRASYQGEANRRLEQQYFDVVILDICPNSACNGCASLESVRRLYGGLQSFRSMS